MGTHPAADEDVICYSCRNAILIDDVKRYDYECPHCSVILSDVHVNRGKERVADIRLNSSATSLDIEMITSYFDGDEFAIEVNGPIPPEGSQQLGIRIYRTYIPPANEKD